MKSFDGSTFDEGMDGERLRKQLYAVWVFMHDKQWHLLKEISREVKAPEASVSARLRDFRKDKFGGHKVERRRVPNGKGLHEYRVPK